MVALSPAIAEILREVGRGHEIVGRHDYDRFTRASVPAVGHQQSISYEALIAARPTHVYLQWGRRELPRRLVSLAEARGWRLATFEMTGLDDTLAAADRLAPAGTDPLPSRAFFDALGALRARVSFGGRVLLLGQAQPPAVLGPGSFHADLLIRLGLRPAVEAGPAWIPTDAEQVAAWSPDAIALVRTGPAGVTAWGRGGGEGRSGGQPAGGGRRGNDGGWSEAESVLGRLATLDAVPAIAERRAGVVSAPDAMLPAPGPLLRVAEGLAALARAWRTD